MFKGHGTGNDFVIAPDVDGSLLLSEQQVRLLCDRHRGIGGDGVLRVVHVALDPEAQRLVDRAATLDPDGARPEWFMDYRNADGSLAEMCGNGVRVFAQYLAETGLAGGAAADATGFPVITRGGVVRVRHAERPELGGPQSEPARWTVQMGRAKALDAAPSVRVGEGTWDALAALEIPNPHVVVRLPDADAVQALDLSRAPAVSPALPDGQNVEFIALTGPRRIAMRVHERGVGETLSCGTGICAAAVAMAAACGEPTGGAPWLVDVPGGTCEVLLREDGGVELTGPAVLVAELSVDAAWLASAR